MKPLRSIILLLAIIATTCVAFAELPSEHITKNPDGSIKTIGKYTRDSAGRVIRFDVADGQGKPLYSEIPYYAEDGRIIRADRLLPDGTLDKVIVFISGTAVILDTTGKVVDQQFSQKEFPFPPDTPTQGQAEETKLPLIVDLPPQWSVTFKGKKGMQFFTVQRTEGEPALLMFSRWPAPGNKDQIPHLVDSLAKGFLGQAKTNPQIKLESEKYKTEKIEGVEFSGESASFTIPNGLVMTMFMISDGDGIWSGQFTGSKERWPEALEILKKLKKS